MISQMKDFLKYNIDLYFLWKRRMEKAWSKNAENKKKFEKNVQLI